MIEIYCNLTKEYSIYIAVIQLRSGKIGFNHFLYTRKVPGIEGPECLYGASKQDGKYVLLFCLSY